jgi:coronin-1B/1C/6
MRIYDPRQPEAIAKVKTGMRTARALFHENVGMIGCGGSIMGARQYNLYDMKKLGGEPVTEFEVDDAAGMMLTHYDEDTSMLYIGGKGGSTIKYFELTGLGGSGGNMHKLSIYSMKTGAKGICFLPKLMCSWQKCVIQKAYVLYRDWINPVEFIVPRKSTLFAKHLYPDTYAGVPALQGAGWFAGENKAPVVRSMNPKEQGKAVSGGVKIVAGQSKSALLAENAKLKARIAELEAQLAAKK